VPDFLKLWTGTVFNLTAGIDDLLDKTFKVVGNLHGLRQRRQQGETFRQAPEEMFGLSCGPQEKLQIEQLLWLQDPPLLRNLIQERAGVGELVQRRGGVFQQEPFGFRGLALSVLNTGQVSKRDDLGEQGMPEVRAHAPCEQTTDLIEL